MLYSIICFSFIFFKMIFSGFHSNLTEVHFLHGVGKDFQTSLKAQSYDWDLLIECLSLSCQK